MGLLPPRRPPTITLDDSDITASVAEINRLDGIGEDVTAANLTELTDGSDTDLHGHAYQPVSEKGQPNGYASLGAGGRVPVAQLASGTPDGTKFVRDDGVLAIPAGAGGGDDPLELAEYLSVGASPAQSGAVRLSGGAISAQGSLTIGAIPTVGNTFTVGSQTYTFVADGTAEAEGEVNVGDTLFAAQTNVLNALAGSDGYNTGNFDAVPFAFVDDVLIVQAILVGTAGNSIPTTETFTSGLNFFDAATLGTTRAGVADQPFVVSRNSNDDGDLRLLGSQTGGYGDWEAARLGGPDLGELQFQTSDGVRAALFDLETELWFFDTGMAFTQNPYGTPRELNLRQGYVDLNALGLHHHAVVANPEQESRASQAIELFASHWNGASADEVEADIYLDAWDDGNPYLYFAVGNGQLVMDDSQQFWPDGDDAGSLGKASARWGDLFIAPPTTDPAVAGQIFSMDAAGLAAALSGGARYLLVSGGA